MPRAARESARARRTVKTAALGTLALLAALIPAATMSAGIARLSAAAPVVLGISPIQVTAGQKALLRLRGRSLRNGMAASFGAGIQVQPTSRATANGSQASLSIRVAASARPGRRQLILVVDGRRTPQNAFITVRAMRVTVPALPPMHLRNPGPPATTMVPGAAILSRVTPQSVRAGSRVDVTLEGRTLRQGLSVDYGPGVHVESLRVLSATRAAATLRIDASAPPGQRLPRASEPAARFTVLPEAALQISSSAPVRVYGITPSAPAAPTPGIRPLVTSARLLGVTPNRLEAGKRYRVTAYGENLHPGLELDLGNGLVIDSVSVLDARRAQVSLHVAAKASPGYRHTRLRTGTSAAWTSQPATLLVQAPFRVVHLPKPKLPAFSARTAIEGRILLKRPRWYSGYASKQPLTDPATGKPLGPGEVVKVGVHVPTVKDETIFVWREQNPGMAEWYEVRFYAGKKLIATRRVDKQLFPFVKKKILPTWLVPDPGLVATLARAAPAMAVSRNRQGGVAVHGKAKRKKSVVGGRKSDFPSSDFTWEVVGYRRYFTSGIEPHAALAARRPVLLASLSSNAGANSGGMGAMVPREIERSDRWPVDVPYHPTGLSCGSEAPSNLDVKRLDNSATSKNKKFSTDVDTAAHTGERWQLTGKLNLDRSPWASHPQKFQPATGHHPKKVLFTTFRFDNVYVDWGDGTVLPLAVSHEKGPNDFKGEVDLTDEMNPHLHAYKEIGSYTVRVYQLAEEDIQDESAGNVSVAANPQGTLFAAAQAASGGGSSESSGKAAPRGFHHAKATGEHAYMLLCRPVVIKPRHDSASDGPLNLVAAKLRGFPEQPGDDTPPKGVSVAPPASEQSSGPRLRTGHGSSRAAHGARRSRAAARSSPGSHDIARFFGTGGGGVPRFSACDVSLTGGGYLYYYGQGNVKLTWYLDGASIGSRRVPLGPSTPRSDRVLAGKHAGSPLISASDLLLSPSVPLNNLGTHRLSFDAQVQYDARALKRLTDLMGRALGRGGGKPDRKLAAELAAGLDGAPPLGVLAPQGFHAAGGGGPVAWLDAPLRRLAQRRPQAVQVAALSARQSRGSHAAGFGSFFHSARRLPERKPPVFIAAPARSYEVVPTTPNAPCTFNFPVKNGGDFIVAGLQGAGNGAAKVTRHGDRWSGVGQLLVPVPGSSGTTKLPILLKFKDWKLQDDGVTVASGSFDLPDPYQSALAMPGADAKMVRLQGKAHDSVRMTLRATLKNPNILATGNQQPPPALQATAELTPKGDWYADGLSLPQLDVYDSGFSVAPKSVALDLSATEGSACGAGNGWMGVAFAKGTVLNAYTFELKKAQAGAVNGWGIDGQGLCGTASLKSYASKVEEHGDIQWDGIEANASGGQFTATYKNVRVHVPWLDTDLETASQVLSAGKGSGGPNLHLNLSGKLPPRTFGPVTLRANSLSFGHLQGEGWAVQADQTFFSFKADGKQFAKDVAVPNLIFGMNGRAYFDENGGTANVSLSGTKGRLSQGVVDLKSMDVVATPKASSRLLFNFSTELRISDALPAAPAPVSYRIDQVSETKYVGSGPVTGTFVVHKPFPDANPSTDSVIHPDYVGSQNGQSASADPGGWLISDANASSGSHMTYCGDVDLGMFGGPPVKGGFALGYEGSDDFWAAHADVSLGQSGTPLVPPYMTLYVVGGGLGYNITLASFASGKSCDVSAKIDHTPVFNAHLQVGDPTHFTYGFDGELSVKVSGPEAGARMDYKAWLVRKDWNGAGDFHGHFLYANGNFDGTLNGHYGFLDNKVYIEAKNDAIAMHFGGGKWYIHAGTKPNPVRGHVLIVNAGAWLGLGNEGMYAGAKAHLNEGAGDCGGACARVTADTLLEADITPQPHIRADAHMHVHADACAFDICLGSGVSGKMHVAALPPELAFGFSLGGCPPGHLNVGLRILPSPKPDIGGGLCAW